MQAVLKCVFCGSERFDIQSGGRPPRRGDRVKCLSCGKDCDYAEREKKAIETAMEEYVRANRQTIIAGASRMTDPKEIEEARRLKKLGGDA